MESASAANEIVLPSICRGENTHTFTEMLHPYLQTGCQNELYGTVQHTNNAQLRSDSQLSPSIRPRALPTPSLSGGNTIIWPLFLIIVSSYLSSVAVYKIKPVI